MIVAAAKASNTPSSFFTPHCAGAGSASDLPVKPSIHGDFVRSDSSGLPGRTHIDRPVSLPDEAFDVAIRFGEIPDSRLIAKKIASNRRLLCASPAYLRSHGRPETPEDLARHDCIELQQNESAYGVWRLARGKQGEAIKVHGKLSTNDGEVALNRALEGHGILMCAEWDVAKYMRSGRLEQMPPDYGTPPSDWNCTDAPPYFGSTHPVLNTAKTSTCVTFCNMPLACKRFVSTWKHGATYRDRTGDNWSHNPVLYQLS